MKLIKKQIDGQFEVEVEIRYARMDSEVAKLIKCIEKTKSYIYGTDNGLQQKILTCDIFYVESVDKKTFIYTDGSVFRSELQIYKLIEILNADDFVQISKSCLINMDVLESIKTLPNSRLEATLINGEKLNVSRKYLTKIKMAFTSKDDDLV